MPKPNTFVVPEYKLVVLGIPKCGQTSMKRAFLGPEVYNVHDRRAHTDTLFYIHNWEVQKYVDKGYKTISIVRNPYDRFLSFYSQKIARPNKYVKSRTNTFYTGMPFEECVRTVCNTADSLSEIHYRSQTAQIILDGKMPFYTGSLENYSASWKELEELLGRDLPPLPWENRTDPDKSIWTPELKGMIYARYQRDFRLLGYEK